MYVDFTDLDTNKQQAFSDRKHKAPSKDPNSIFVGLGTDDLDWFSFETKVRSVVQ